MKKKSTRRYFSAVHVILIILLVAATPVLADQTCPLCGGSGTIPSTASDATLLALDLELANSTICGPLSYVGSMHWYTEFIVRPSMRFARFGYPRPGNPGMPPRRSSIASSEFQFPLHQPVFPAPKDTDPVEARFAALSRGALKYQCLVQSIAGAQFYAGKWPPYEIPWRRK